MAFQRYLCWQKDRVYTVMNPDAESVSDEVFLAVHSDHPLTLMDPNPASRQDGTGSRWQLEPREFLQAFFDPSRRHVQAIVQGDSGSGKSHFIKWMALNIQEQEDRYLLTIPKAGMSLRRIVERIIAILPQDRQQPYQERLNQIGQHAATREQRRESLINRIAEAINSDSRRAEQLSEEEEWLIGNLPSIFYDPHLRTFLDKQGGVIDDLVEHIFEAPYNYERLESRRVFRREDLPLVAQDIHQMSRKAQQALAPLVSDDVLASSALVVINRNLDRAIPLVLNFTGDQLIELMLDLRRCLRDAGKQLVLLIEDFARLQGIDGALLQALIEAGSETNGLCEMRWAMAVTRGYYESSANTVQTRTHFLIDMDLPTSGSDAVASTEYIVSFAARYLNAARLTGESLQEWRDVNRDATHEDDVPNACDSCEFRTPCHAAFGAIYGLGLYPFTQNGILNMAGRKDPHLSERFNPRVLIKDVLAEVLGNYGSALEGGQFPPDQLLQVMGGSKLPPLDEDNLKRNNPDSFLRQRAVLGLWGEQPGVFMQLPEGIYEAFALDIPPLVGLEIDQRLSKEDEQIAGPPVSVRTALDQRADAIQEWGREGTLREQVAQYLHDPIYYALEAYIDWDGAGLERKKFARRADGPFRARYIIFRDQQTSTRPAAHSVSLTIPLSADDEDERRTSAIALEGLLRFKELRTWNFPGGLDMLMALNDCLGRWSQHLIDAFRRLPISENKWEPIPVAVETLAIGVILAGRPAKSNATLPDYLNALFETLPPPTEITAQTREWQELYRAVYERRQTAIDIVRALSSGSKGGQVGGFIDPGLILPALQRIRRTWVPTVNLPGEVAGRSDDYGNLGKIYSRIARDLPTAAQAEWDRKVAWLERVRHYLPEGVSRRDAADTLAELLWLVNEYGVSCRPAVMRAFDEGLAEFRRIQLDDSIRTIQSLREAASPIRVLSQLARDRTDNAIGVTERFFPAVDAFFAELTARLSSQEANLGHDGQTLQQDQERIRRSFQKLDLALETITTDGRHVD
ncbi:hypothetical protein NKDENANG_00360 [Candidatus Entotheonellaceae bacterium PAL068K]